MSSSNVGNAVCDRTHEVLGCLCGQAYTLSGKLSTLITDVVEFQKLEEKTD